MIIGYILLIIALIEIVISYFLIFKYQKSLSTIFFGLFTFSAAIYVGSNGVAYAQSYYTGVSDALAWAGGALATAFYFAFSFSFPFPKKKISELIPWVAWPIVIFIPSILFTDAVIIHQPKYFIEVEYLNTPGPIFWLFIIWFLVYWIWALFNFIQYYRQSSGFYRWLVRILLVGIVVSLTSSLVFDIFLPIFIKSPFGFVGSLLTSVWVIGVGYIIIKK